MSTDVKMKAVSIVPIPGESKNVEFVISLSPAPDRAWVAAFDQVTAANPQWGDKGFTVGENTLHVTCPENALAGVKRTYLDPLIASVNLAARSRRSGEGARVQELRDLEAGYNRDLFS